MIYVSTACVQRERIGDIIKEYAEHGIRKIELSGGTHFYQGIEADLKRLKSEYDLEYACHAYFPPPKKDFVINLGSCNDEIYQKSIEHYMECIEMLHRINVCVLSVHAGFLIEVGVEEIGKIISNYSIYDTESVIDRFCRAYEMIEKRANEYGIRMFLENNVLSHQNFLRWNHQNHMLMTDCASIEKVRQKMHFQLLLDLGHLKVSCNTLGLSYDKQVQQLAPEVRWFHVSNNNGIEDEHKLLSAADEIVSMLLKFGRKEIPVTLEAKGTMSEVVSNYRMLENIQCDMK